MDRHHIGFAVAGSVLSIIFFIVVNLLTSPDYLWFIYPAFAVIIWPASVILIWRGKYKLHALFGSLLLIAFLSIINFLHSPHHPWILYTIILIIWWPISVFCGERAKTVSFALVASMCIIMYYSLLNIMMLHQYPWAIYPAYAVLWWPLALHYVRKKDFFGLSVAGSLLSILFFIVVNVVSSPNTIWAIYPIFAILWWPLSMYYYYFKKKKQKF